MFRSFLPKVAQCKGGFPALSNPVAI
ncbi:hypothetical protein AGR4B_Cc60088 [Agrobacterium tumefaciens str. CFBP 5621]|nr:hypothetical protein AGR4B_Cc60088 [Agrobacterium tumefaciens str. CFBP 5621]